MWQRRRRAVANPCRCEPQENSLRWLRKTMGLLQSLRARFSRSSPDEERRALTARTPRRQRSKSHSSLKVERLSTLELPTEQLQSKLARLLSSSSGDSSSEADTHLASASSLAADVEAQIEELSTLLRLQLRHDLQESSLWLVDAFDALATGGHGDAALPDRFIDGLCELMQRANFRLLAQREWEFAQAENFMFTLPVTVAWEKLDSSMISRLFVRHPHVGLQAAQLARRVLVFHRGAGVLQKTSFFLEEKLDFLLDYAFTEPLRRLWGCLCLCLGLQRTTAAAPMAPPISRKGLGAASSDLAAVGLQKTTRINLRRLMPGLCSLLRRLCLRLTVQEPTFREVVVLYDEVGASAEDAAEEEACGGLRLKSFRDIPIADVEVVFPGLRVERIRSADGIKIGFILLAGVATALYSFYVSRGDNLTVTATLITLLLWRMIMTWYYIISAKWGMDKFIQTTLYHRSQDSKKGVLLYVVNSIETHELRECLLLYALLLHHAAHPAEKAPAAAAAAANGKAPHTPHSAAAAAAAAAILPPPAAAAPAADGADDGAAAGTSAADAERLCSDFLDGEFGVSARVNAEAALERLVGLGLVVAAGGGRYAPVAMPQVLLALRAAWSGQLALQQGGLAPPSTRRVGSHPRRKGAALEGLTSPTTPTSRSRSESGVYSSEAVFGVYSSPV